MHGRAAEPRAGFCSVWPQLAVLAGAAQLRTDFARRARRGVDVHVRRSCPNGPNEVIEVAVGDPLSRPSRYADDVRGPLA